MRVMVLVKGDAVGPTMYYGAGAGAEPTASAVIADLVDVARMHTADPEHRVPHLAFQPDQLSDLAVLPIGDNFTMGPSDALKAVAMLRPQRVVPIHYNTFPVIKQDPLAWADLVRQERVAEPVVLKPGDWMDV